MPEIKRTQNNPSLMLVKTVISLSKSDNWDDAKKEWKMLKYCYASTHKTCPCSPREVSNITVLKNVHNFNELEVCNSCAERHFGYWEGTSIESIVRKIRKDTYKGMDRLCLDYLFINKVIDRNEYNNYCMFKGKRKDQWLQDQRQKTNLKLLNFTNYTHQHSFKKMDAVLYYSIKNRNINIYLIGRRRDSLLNEGIIDERELDDIIKYYGLSITTLTYNQLRKARVQLDEIIKTTCLLNRDGMDRYKHFIFSDECPVVEESDGLPSFNISMLDGLEDINTGKVISIKKRKKERESRWINEEIEALSLVYKELKTFDSENAAKDRTTVGNSFRDTCFDDDSDDDINDDIEDDLDDDFDFDDYSTETDANPHCDEPSSSCDITDNEPADNAEVKNDDIETAMTLAIA